MPVFRSASIRMEIGTLVEGNNDENNFLVYRVVEVSRTNFPTPGWRHQLVKATPDEEIVFLVMNS
jgi:hypothetical protein